MGLSFLLVLFLMLFCVLVVFPLGHCEAFQDLASSKFNKTLSFSGYTWMVESSGSSKSSPGPNYFSSLNSIVDFNGRMRLRIQKIGGTDYVCAKTSSTSMPGYGLYEFKVVSPYGLPLDDNVVLSLGLQGVKTDLTYPRVMILIRTSQITYLTSNGAARGRLMLTSFQNATSAIHRFNWRPKRIDFQALSLLNSDSVIVPNDFDPYYIPDMNSQLSLRIELWLKKGSSSFANANKLQEEVIVEKFTFSKNRMSFIVPLYVYPTTTAVAEDWDTASSGQLYTNTTIIFNPNNGNDATTFCDGKGAGIMNPDWLAARSMVASYNATGIGYIYTTYGNRTIGQCTALIYSYLTCWNMSGIFIDEVESFPRNLSYYSTLYNFIKTTKPSATVWLNPGTVSSEALMNVSDVVIMFEEDVSALESTYEPASYMDSYPSSRFGAIVKGVSVESVPETTDLLSSMNFGWSYLLEGQSYTETVSTLFLTAAEYLPSGQYTDSQRPLS